MVNEHELLLRAALLQREPALAAWAEWMFGRMRDRSALDAASRRLLPLLYLNLQRHGVEERLMAPVRAAYLRNRARNERLLGAVADELRALHEEGIQTLVLKGAALALLHYGDLGARSMGDVDVLVPRERAPSAMALLRERGWIHDGQADPTVHLPYRHAADFRHPEGWHLDLHWRVLIEWRDGDSDEAFWRAARELVVGGVTTRALCPADQLLHVCVHGKNWRHIGSSISWIPDALTIIGSSGDELDWDRLVREAEVRRLGFLLRRALEHLADEFGARVPPPVLSRLRSRPRSAFERLTQRIEYRIMSTERRTAFLGKLPLLWFRWRRQSLNGRGGGEESASFLDYLRHYWRLEHSSQVPLHFLAKALRRAIQIPAERLQRR